MGKPRILFIRNGGFSFTNDFIAKQLARTFPDGEIVNHDVGEDTYRHLPFFALNTLRSVLQYGWREVVHSGRRGFYFFRTDFFFKHATHRFYKRLVRRKEAFDLVIQTQGIFDGKLPGVPLLIYTDYTYRSASFGGAPVSPFLVERERRLFRSADKIAVSAGHVRQLLLDDYGCEPDRVETIYIGSNSDDAAVPAEPGRFASRQVCFVGIDWVRKGGEDLLSAFELVLRRFPDARLVIAGASPAVRDGRVTVLGRIPRAEVAKLYRSSAAFCLPSRVEPSSVAAVEAATHGLPVVATRVGGFFDSVADGTTGLLVPPRDPEALAAALCTVIGDPALAERMGAAGRLHARERFDWDKVGDRLAGLARSVCRAS